MKKTTLSLALLASSVQYAIAQDSAPQDFTWAKDHRKAQIWDPQFDENGPTETMRVRIVDFGQANCRWNNKVSYAKEMDGSKVQNIYDVDVDGNPKTDDWIQTVPFSLTEDINIPRMSPRSPQWDTSWDSSMFYGGMGFIYAGRTDNGLTEAYVNTAEGDEAMKPGSDWAIHAQHRVKGSPFRGYFAPVWRKEEFPHLGNTYPVSFDETSKIGLYTQRYWDGYDGVRFVIKNNGQLYLSEKLENNWRKGIGLGSTYDLRIVYPTQFKWSKWDVQEGDWDLQLKNEKLSLRTFNNVQAIGFYIYKDAFTDKEVSAKWECFESYANVTRPRMPSETIDMKKVNDFYIATCETPYEVWKRIFRMSRSIGQFVFDEERGMLYDRFGNMGSQQFGSKKHDHSEPVTGLTLYDIIAWCNALSEYEGRDFVYYTTPDFQKGTELRNNVKSPFSMEMVPDSTKNVFVKWESDGFRLPTPAEWKAAQEGRPNTENAWIQTNSLGSTNPVGTKTANSKGLYDMHGNVWELVWTHGDTLPADFNSLSAVGGGFNYPDNPMEHSASSYGDTPFVGNYNIGFRLIRREKGAAKPDTSFHADDFGDAVWTIKKGEKTASRTAEAVEIPFVDIPEGTIFKGKNKVTMTAFKMGSHEISYKQWKPVFDWAKAHGYTFDSDGDMGSMDHRLYVVQSHSPDEPVTDISFFDMLTWCNALSEMNGLTPVFYADKEKTQIYKTSYRYRQSQLMARNYTKASKIRSWKGAEKRKCYIKWEANGYRLPTTYEWTYAYCPSSTTYPWGNDYSGLSEQGWGYENAQGRTHPIGLKKPNAWGLYDMAGNAVEPCMDSTGKGGKIQRGQTVNPVFSTNAADSYNTKTRVTFKQTGFIHYNRNKIYMGEKSKINTGGFAGIVAGWYWPDCSFRIVKRNTGDYPPLGYDPSKKPTDFTRIKLNRTPSEK